MVFSQEFWEILKNDCIIEYHLATASNVHHFRSLHRSCSMKKATLTNFAIFAGKHLCWSLILMPEGLQLYLKGTQTHMFSCEYCQNFKNPILRNICERLLLIIWSKVVIKLQNDIVVIALLRTLGMPLTDTFSLRRRLQIQSFHTISISFAPTNHNKHLIKSKCYFCYFTNKISNHMRRQPETTTNKLFFDFKVSHH